MTAHRSGAPLEQSCISPGNWLIEGYTVQRRTRTDGRIRWWIAKSGQHVGLVRTLGAARDLIRHELDR